MCSWQDVEVVFSEFFNFLEKRNNHVAKNEKIKIDKDIMLGYYAIFFEVPSADIASCMLFPNPPACRDNVYVPIEMLEEIEITFAVKPKEIIRYLNRSQTATRKTK